MPITKRRARPIARDETKLRDARLFVIATEDRFAAKQYFSFFQHSRIHVRVLETDDRGCSSPAAVVSRLVKFAEEYQLGEDDRMWALLDTDHWIQPNHKRGLIEAINDARSRKYRIAMSKPCFDLWLLLHHEEVLPTTTFPDCEAVGDRIREVLGEFNKRNLKQSHYTNERIELACRRAKAADVGFTSAAADFWPDGTVTRVYLLMAELASLGLIPRF